MRLAAAIFVSSLALGSDLSDPKLTPGVSVNVSVAKLCKPGYAKSVRNVRRSVNKRVYKEYGIQSHRPGQYEVDHLISLELGGSNDIKNLWPQPYEGEWNAHMKDRLEDELHAMVCAGKVSLPQAQEWISKDWVSAYSRIIGK